jgi:hypothetical protein
MIRDFIAASVNQYIDQGDDYYSEFTLKKTTGVVLDLTGYTLSSLVKAYLGISTVDAAATVTIVNPTLGVIGFFIPAVQTVLLTRSSYVFQIIGSKNSDVDALVAGTIYVKTF